MPGVLHLPCSGWRWHAAHAQHQHPTPALWVCWGRTNLRMCCCAAGLHNRAVAAAEAWRCTCGGAGCSATSYAGVTSLCHGKGWPSLAAPGNMIGGSQSGPCCRMACHAHSVLKLRCVVRGTQSTAGGVLPELGCQACTAWMARLLCLHFTTSSLGPPRWESPQAGGPPLLTRSSAYVPRTCTGSWELLDFINSRDMQRGGGSRACLGSTLVSVDVKCIRCCVSLHLQACC